MRRSDIHYVPPVNSADNVDSSDVLGQKGDGHDGTSAMAVLHTLEEHVHSPGTILPNATGAVTVTSDAVPWTYGDPESLGTPGIGDFDGHWLEVTAGNNSREYQFEVLIDGVHADEGAFESGPAGARSFSQPLQMTIHENAQITVRLMDDTGSGTARFKIKVHPY